MNKIKCFLKSCPDKKAVILVNLINPANRLEHYLSAIPKDSAFIFWGIDIPHGLKERGLNTKTSESYLDANDYKAIDSYVFGGLSKSWYLYNSITDYKGIHLGKIFEYDFQKFLVPRIKNLEILSRVCSAEKPEKIIVLDDSGELCIAARLYAKTVNIPVLTLRLNNRKTAPAARINPWLRRALAQALTGVINYVSLRRLYRQADLKHILVDAKLFNYFTENNNGMTVVPFILDGGFNYRWKMFSSRQPYLSFYSSGRLRYLKEYSLYIRRWHNLSANKEFRDIFTYKGIPLWGIFHLKLADFFLKGIPRIISNFKLLDNLCQGLEIRSMLLRNDVKEQERTLILSLRLHKIPSLVMQHGILAESNGHNELLADKFIAWGKASADWYNKFGNSKDKFFIAGNPRFDVLKDWKPVISRDVLYGKLGRDVNKKTILFATQQVNKFSSFWTDDLFWVMADELLKYIEGRPDIQLIIKCDPYEDVLPYNRIAAYYPGAQVTTIRNFDIYTLIYNSDLVITLDSTVGLEAMLFDKPLITFNLTAREDRVPYAQKGAAVAVYKDDALGHAIERVLNDKNLAVQLKEERKKFILEYANNTENMAREKMLAIVREK